MSRALALVEDVRSRFADSDGPRVTLTAFLVKACAWALQRHPALNASLEGEHILEWAEINIGVAVAVEEGLIVPVIHGADELGLVEIATRLTDLTTRAREGRLRPEDVQGGTFTLSNLGMFGVDRFTAILNPPQAAILAVGRVAKRPLVIEDDRVVVRPMATLTLTADHRVVDGALAGGFLDELRGAIERPGVLM
jgi:pyruvate dehydrogenase E2 component (dihydrolipoamide acetyltransferase)